MKKTYFLTICLLITISASDYCLVQGEEVTPPNSTGVSVMRMSTGLPIPTGDYMTITARTRADAGLLRFISKIDTSDPEFACTPDNEDFHYTMAIRQSDNTLIACTREGASGWEAPSGGIWQGAEHKEIEGILKFLSYRIDFVSNIKK